MKKLFIIASTMIIPFLAAAQNNQTAEYDSEIFRTCSIIFLIGMFMLFILTIMKKIMDYRLKDKIVEKGIPENIAASILQTNPEQGTTANIKWFAILAGLGAGFTIIYFTPPMGIHSLAIMAFCLAASFLGYYLFLKKTGQ